MSIRGVAIIRVAYCASTDWPRTGAGAGRKLYQRLLTVAPPEFTCGGTTPLDWASGFHPSVPWRGAGSLGLSEPAIIASATEYTLTQGGPDFSQSCFPASEADTVTDGTDRSPGQSSHHSHRRGDERLVRLFLLVASRDAGTFSRCKESRRADSAFSCGPSVSMHGTISVTGCRQKIRAAGKGR